MFDKKKAGRALQAARQAAGFRSARALADALGYNVYTYTEWEQGRYTYSIEQGWEIADMLHVTLDELCGREFKADTLRPGEKALIDSYRKADDRGKETIQVTADSQAALSGEGQESAEVPDNDGLAA